MTHAVEHDLGDRPLAVRALAGRLVIDCLGQAIDRPTAIVCRRREHEVAGRTIWPLGERQLTIGLDRLLDRQRPEEIGLLQRLRKRRRLALARPAPCPAATTTLRGDQNEQHHQDQHRRDRQRHRRTPKRSPRPALAGSELLENHARRRSLAFDARHCHARRNTRGPSTR